MMTEEDKRFWIRLGVIVIVGLVGILFYQWLSSPLIVQVTGVGSVQAPASTAAIAMTVTENNPSPVVAVTNVQNKADAIRAILTSKGFAEADLAESQVTVMPAGMVVAGLTGYQATISLGGKTVQVKNLAQLIGSLYERGAAYVSQPTLTVDNSDELEKKAVQEAMKDAHAKAKQIAGVRHKFILTIGGVSETDSSLTGTATTKTQAEGESKFDATAVNGADTFKINKVVTVTYRMW